MKIAVFAGDGIGSEIMAQALRVLDALRLPGAVYVEGERRAFGAQCFEVVPAEAEAAE